LVFVKTCISTLTKFDIHVHVCFTEEVLVLSKTIIDHLHLYSQWEGRDTNYREWCFMKTNKTQVPSDELYCRLYTVSDILFIVQIKWRHGLR